MLLEQPTDLELTILGHLATYRFLTNRQLLTLGVTKHERHLQATLRSMAGAHRKPRVSQAGQGASTRSAQPERYRPYRSPVINRFAFGVLSGVGRLPYVYALTEHGAFLLAVTRVKEPVHVPSVVSFPKQEYFHRLGCIDCHLAIRTWAERNRSEIDFYHVDFTFSRKLKGRPIADTRVELKGGRAIKPDAIFQFTASDRKPRLCALEFSAGTETARIENQLDAYRYALHEGAISRAFSYEHGIRVLAVFRHESTLTNVFERLATRSDFQPFGRHFLFTTLTELQRDVLSGWRQLGKPDRVPFFVPSA